MAFNVPDELADSFGYMYSKQSGLIVFLMKSAIQTYMVDDVDTACTDSKKILCGSTFFAPMNMYQKAYVWGHEILHCIFNHPHLILQWQNKGDVTGKLKDGTIKTYPFINKIAQIAFDLLVNDFLFNCGFKQEHAPSCRTWDTNIGGWKDLEDDLYVRVYDIASNGGQNKPNDGGEPGDGTGKPCGGASDVIPKERDHASGNYEKHVKEALEDLAKQHGTIAGGMQALVNRIAPTRMDWRDIVRPMVRSVTGKGKQDWARVNRVLLPIGMVEPQSVGRRAGTICLAIDTSGSVGNEERQYFLGAMGEIFKQCKPKRLIVLEVDAIVHRVTEIKHPGQLRNFEIEVTEKSGLRGNGGTDMREVKHWQEEEGEKPELTIILTDMGTPFPHSRGPSKRVVWIATTATVAPEEAGETVRLWMR